MRPNDLQFVLFNVIKTVYVEELEFNTAYLQDSCLSEHRGYGIRQIDPLWHLSRRHWNPLFSRSDQPWPYLSIFHSGPFCTWQESKLPTLYESCAFSGSPSKYYREKRVYSLCFMQTKSFFLDESK